MDEFAFSRTFYQVAVLLMKWQLVAPFLLSTAIDIYFFFMTVTAENQLPTSMLSRKEVKHALPCVINLDGNYSQATKPEEADLIQTCVSRDRHRKSLSCSCSQVVSSEVLLVTNGFLAHSNF
jgi:hypothetical protein